MTPAALSGRPSGSSIDSARRQRSILATHLGDSEATARTVDADGWLHTGDIGVVDGEGYLRRVLVERERSARA
jgi:acyl-CoA synthetase (AMP-forming)/AMP-acid ligase II